jgi:predicted hydrolase (HD superfamily)
MDYGVTRERSIELLNQYLNSPNLMKHSLASEAVMRSLAYCTISMPT